jgi:hypothetical protein
MPKKKPLRPMPRFDDEAQEHEFWSTHDSTDYIDWSRAKRVTFGRLKPSTQAISIRGAAVRQPIFGAQACAPHAQRRTRRGNGRETPLWAGWPGAVHQALAVLVEEADGPGAGSARRCHRKRGAVSWSSACGLLLMRA